MPNFGIAIGWNADAGDIADFIPYQPLTEGFQWTRRSTTVDGLVDEGGFIRFMFSILTEDENRDMLTQSGVYTLRTCQVTIKAQDENYSWTFFNGWSNKPQNAGRKGFHLMGVPLLINGLFGATT